MFSQIIHRLGCKLYQKKNLVKAPVLLIRLLLSGILCVAIATLISIFGTKKVLSVNCAHLINTYSNELPSITLSQIDHAVFSHQGNLQQILSSLSDSTQNQLIHARQLSTIKSFIAVILMCFTMTNIGLIRIFFFEKSKT